MNGLISDIVRTTFVLWKSVKRRNDLSLSCNNLWYEADRILFYIKLYYEDLRGETAI